MLVKAAIAKGDTLRVAELQRELRGVELAVIGASAASSATRAEEEPMTTIPRKKRAKKVDQNIEVNESKITEITE